MALGVKLWARNVAISILVIKILDLSMNVLVDEDGFLELSFDLMLDVEKVENVVSGLPSLDLASQG